jgi:cytochrome c oxidase subunit 3/cytochrome o ubiquinol oxidase subunit 3
MEHSTAPAASGAISSHSSGHEPLTAGHFSLTTAQYGMLAFLASEVALFSTLIVTYLMLLGKDSVGPTPREALSLPLVMATTCCLLASSATIHKAEGYLRLGQLATFHRWWAATIALGTIFLSGTAYEWNELIVDHHLTISRNLFGSTYYTLVGFHGLHVTCGVLTMLILWALVSRRDVGLKNSVAIELASWYWHFVDVVWVVVFLVVYIVGR